MDAENPSPARLRSAGDLAGDGGGGLGWGVEGDARRGKAEERRRSGGSSRVFGSRMGRSGRLVGRQFLGGFF
jgi:hypothetical protein